MERYSYDLFNSLHGVVKIDLFKNSRGKLFLPIFFLHFLCLMLYKRKRYTHIHFCDALLAPLAVFSGLLTSAKISVTVHALDVIYDKYLYQQIVPACLRRISKLVAVSRFTLEQCVSRGVPEDRCHLIPNGLDDAGFDIKSIKINAVAEQYGFDLAGRKLLLSVGRLIRRKGTAWFVEKVMPALGENYVYVIAGDGPERPVIQEAVDRLRLQDQVYLLGRISDQEKYGLYHNAELFIMPNIRVAGDAEGFGISIIESAALGTPAIASSIEGIKDAVTDGVTGALVEPGKADGFIEAIRKSNFDREIVRKVTREKFSWSVLKQRYLEEIFC